MFKTRMLQLIVLAGALFVAPFGQAQVEAKSGTVHLNPEPGNTIGYETNGAETWRHGIDGIMYGSDHISRANDGVNMFFQRGNDKWLFQFVAPLYDEADDSYDGQPLHIGLYDNVSGDWRYEPMQAGMLISSPMGMAWEWSGWFNVLDIAYAANGDLSRFAVDFMQYDTLNQTGPGLSGSLRYNSAIPIAEIPEPGTWMLMLGGLGLLAVVARRRRR